MRSFKTASIDELQAEIERIKKLKENLVKFPGGQFVSTEDLDMQIASCEAEIKSRQN